MAHKQLMGMWRSEAGGCSRAGDLSTTCKLDEDVGLFVFLLEKKRMWLCWLRAFFLTENSVLIY